MFRLSPKRRAGPVRSECGSRGDDGRFGGHEAGLDLVLSQVVDILSGLDAASRDGLALARSGALEVVDVHVEIHARVPGDKVVKVADVVNFDEGTGPCTPRRHAAVGDDGVSNAFSK